jgi:hypothetical protein
MGNCNRGYIVGRRGIVDAEEEAPDFEVEVVALGTEGMRHGAPPLIP